MLGKFANPDVDLAAPANGAAATDRVDINTKLACCRQHRCAHGKTSTLAGRGENNEGILLGHDGVLYAKPGCRNGTNAT